MSKSSKLQQRPPEGEEYNFCRLMWIASSTLAIHGQEAAVGALYDALSVGITTNSWYKHNNCSCIPYDIPWTLKDPCFAISAFYEDYAAVMGTTETVMEYREKKKLLEEQKVAARKMWAYVRSEGLIKDSPAPGEPIVWMRLFPHLYGYYSIKQYADHYLFTEMNNYPYTGPITVVPLNVKMGEGDFKNVTPDKIVKM